MTTTLLILDSNEANVEGNRFSYRFTKPLVDVKRIALKKALVNCETSNSVLYVRSNLSSKMRNRTVASDSSGKNRNTDIIAILQYDPETSNSDTLVTTNTTASAQTIQLETTNNEKLFSGTIFRVQRSGTYNTNEDTTIYLRSKNSQPLNIELTSFSTGNANDTLEIFEWRDGDVDDFQVFKIGGSTSGTHTTTHPNIGLNFVTNNSSTASIDLKIYENTGTVSNYNLTTTSTSNVNKIVCYKESDATHFALDMTLKEIMELDLRFCSTLTGEPIPVNSFNLVFEVQTGNNFL